MESIYEFGAMLIPLYLSGIYNAVQLAKLNAKYDNCIFCQRSRTKIKALEKEVN